MTPEFGVGITTVAGRRSHGAAAELVIGLINNMPKAAKRATEQQFAGLLAVAGHDLSIKIRLLPVERFLTQTDEAFDLLREARPDGLIVTGNEPQAVSIIDEPLWPVLARLVEWAGDNTISSVWSCLAAHAAVFCLDNISRRRLPQKLSGQFVCAAAAHHPLLAELPSRWLVPHSRHNGLDESELWSKGYTVLSHAPSVGPDSFVKHVRSSLFLLLQGHPEYEPDSLFREYRRDVRRFLSGQRDVYPDVPEGYFDRQTAGTLARLRHRTCRMSRAELLASVDAAFAAAPAPAFNRPALQLYTNWLAYLLEQKAERDNTAGWSSQQQRGVA